MKLLCLNPDCVYYGEDAQCHSTAVTITREGKCAYYYSIKDLQARPKEIQWETPEEAKKRREEMFIKLIKHERENSNGSKEHNSEM